MYYLKEMCGLCLSISNIPFKDVHSKSEETLTYFQKITSYLSELKSVIESDHNFIICEKCCDTINMIYNFNQNCLHSVKMLTSYKNILQGNKDKKRCNLSVKIKKMEYETVAIKKETNFDDMDTSISHNIEHIQIDNSVRIKTEPETYDDNFTFMNNNPSTSSNFNVLEKDILEKTVIKEELDDLPDFENDELSNFENESQNQTEDLDMTTDTFDSSVNNYLTLENYDQNEESEDEVLPELSNTANDTIQLLPEKSKDLYDKEYNIFMSWCKGNEDKNITEDLMLTYFKMLSKNKKSSTLWTTYSKLRSCLNVYDNFDISRYTKLQDLLKELSRGYVAKKSKVLDITDINKFLLEADDKLYLAIKVILIMGYNGACRRAELVNMRTDDIEFKDGIILVSIPKSKNYNARIFTITDSYWVQVVKKYANLRPKDLAHTRFFLTYRSGYCIKSPIGINTVGKVPSLIAEFLKLPNPEQYTGQCFRRSSASELSNSGGDLITITKHGGVKRKIGIARCLAVTPNASDNLQPTPSTSQNQNTNFQHDYISSENLPGVSNNAEKIDIKEEMDDLPTFENNISNFENETQIQTEELDIKMDTFDSTVNYDLTLGNYDQNEDSEELTNTANDAIPQLLPEKSKDLYDKEYNIFMNWCKENKVKSVSENVMLTYFKMQSKNKKSPTLRTTYSKLRSCLNVYDNVDISKYMKLQALLKQLSRGYVAKKSKVLEITDINKFIVEADDKLYLAIKVILIIGYNGACRRVELVNMSINDIKYKDDIILVTIPKTKNYNPRIFTITDSYWVQLVKKYVNLRPKDLPHDRFFLTYRSGYCIKCPIGINTLGKVPSLIAEFLKLPNPEQYTGQCFRRSSASELANSGLDLLTLEKNGGWKSSAVAEGYVELSIKRKIEIGQCLATTSNAYISSENLHGISIN